MDVRKAGVYPINLRCEYKIDPIGIETQNPRLTWELTAGERNRIQSAYQILVSESLEALAAEHGGMWDTGKIASDETVNIIYNGKKLMSGRKYYWKVRAWDNDNQPSPYSAPASFETGLFSPDCWKGIWIKAEDHMSAPFLRRVFCIKSPVARARVYACGLGYHVLSMNGNRISGDLLVPDRTEYGKRVFYYTYDVTNMLSQGENVIGAILGNGWYNQNDKPNVIPRWYGYPKLMLQLNIEYEDGTSVSVSSDLMWKYSQGPIVYNNVFLGEVYDSRRELEGWDKPNYGDQTWKNVYEAEPPQGRLTAATSGPRRMKERIKPVKMVQPGKGIFVFDMGRCISGWVRLKARGPEGTMVHMRFADEVYENGMIDTFSTGFGFDRQVDVFILKGKGEEVFEPQFTWHGFRYVEVKGYPGIPQMEDVEGCLIYTELESSGGFTCSNPLFNRLQKIWQWTLATHAQDGLITDSFRERQAYIGDLHVIAEASIYNYRMANHFLKNLDDMADAQHDESGYIPHTAPYNGGGGGPCWGAGYILIAWGMYRFYGDVKVLRDHYENMKKWMKYLESCTNGSHIITSSGPDGSTRTSCGFPERNEPEYRDPLKMEFLGEWGLLDEIDVPPALVNTYFYFKNAWLMSRIAGLLGCEADSKGFKKLAEEIGDAFNRSFLDEANGMYSIGRQGSDAFAVDMGIVPEELKNRVLAHIEENIMMDNKGHLDTGIYGTKCLLNVLVDNNMAHVADSMMNKDDIPSFGYMVANGATALWEGFRKDHSVYDYVLSHSQPMFGSYSAWFFEKLAGIAADDSAGGFRKFIISPHPMGSLDYARANVKTVRGEASVGWEKAPGSFSIRVSIPANCTADLFIPKLGFERFILKESDCILLQPGMEELLPEGVSSLTVGDEAVRIGIGSGVYSFFMAEY